MKISILILIVCVISSGYSQNATSPDASTNSTDAGNSTDSTSSSSANKDTVGEILQGLTGGFLDYLEFDISSVEADTTYDWFVQVTQLLIDDLNDKFDYYQYDEDYNSQLSNSDNSNSNITIGSETLYAPGFEANANESFADYTPDPNNYEYEYDSDNKDSLGVNVQILTSSYLRYFKYQLENASNHSSSSSSDSGGNFNFNNNESGSSSLSPITNIITSLIAALFKAIFKIDLNICPTEFKNKYTFLRNGMVALLNKDGASNSSPNMNPLLQLAMSFLSRQNN